MCDAPKDPRENRLFRAWLRQQCEANKRRREWVLERCRNDIVFYVDSFVWQFNPKKKGRAAVAPFVAWDFQQDALAGRPETWNGDPERTEKGLLWCYENGKTAVVEKSRYMGWTWLSLIFEDWLCLFQPYTVALNISRSAEAVDDNTPDSLHWKLRFMHSHLPEWLRGEIVEQKMHLHYKRTKSHATGEASTGRAGVGGRAGVIFVDEVSKIREAPQVRQRTANTADCRIFVSTHEGSDQEFYRMTKTPEFVQIRTHWIQHPEMSKGMYRFDAEKNQVAVLDQSNPPPIDYDFVRSEKPTGGPHPGVRSPAYDAKCVEIGNPRAVAVEMDIDVLGSTSQVFDPLAILHLIRDHCRPWFWEGTLDFDPQTCRPNALVQKAGGLIKLWIVPKADGTVPLGLYAGGTDVATGSGATPSCLAIGNAETGEKVLEYADANIKPEAFAALSVALCHLFGSPGGRGAKLCWECPGPGMTFGDEVLRLGYRNVYYWQPEGVPEGITPRASFTKAGWYTSPVGKQKLLTDYETALIRGQVINRSEAAMRETLRFEYLASGQVEHAEIASVNDPSGARVNHGDRTIADALMTKMMRSLGLGKLVLPPPVEDSPPYGSLAWRKDWHRQREMAMED